MARDVAVLGAVRSGGRAKARRGLRAALLAQVLVIAWVVTGAAWLPGWQALTAAGVGAVLLAALRALGGARARGVPGGRIAP